MMMFGALLALGSIKKRFIKRIFYNPSTNSMNFELYTVWGAKTVTNIPAQALQLHSTIGKNNKVERKLLVKDPSVFSGYSYFGMPNEGSWHGKNIFDSWLAQK